jgi:hypothetical protein
MSTRGRKAAPAPDAPNDKLDHVTLAADSAALTEIGRRSAEVAEVFGDGLPYDRNRVISECRFYMGQSAEAMLEAGKRLVQIKENEPHGEWTRICEENLGLAARTARTMMQAAVRFLGPDLASKRPAPAVLALGRTKLIELLTQPDDVIEELEQGGTVAGMTLDELESMSARELREALRAEKAARAKDAKAKQKVIDGKESKITALEEQLAHRNTAEPGELESYQLSAVRDAGLAAEMAVRQLIGEANTVLQSPASEATATAARQAVEFVAQVFAGLINEHGIPVDFETAVSPEWLKAAGSKSKKR